MKVAIVFDTETTGSDETDQIIEAAWLELDESFGVVGEFCQRYKPSVPINIGAMATHHILESELVDCWPSTDFVFPEVEYVIGHKVDFDMGMAKQAEDYPRRICTLALARRYLPDLPTHTQSALMYHFYGDAARPLVRDAHNALCDVQNCHRILMLLIDVIREAGKSVESLEDLYVVSEDARIPIIMPFGKCKDERIADMPYKYKQWILSQPDFDKYIVEAVRRSL